MTRSMVMGQTELAAHHEAGHAIAAYICQRKIRSITIEGEGAGMVRCQGLRHEARARFSPRQWRTLVREEIYICLAGPIAEQRVSGRDDPAAWGVDLQMAEDWRQYLEVDAKELTASTRKLLEEKRTWAAVSTAAARLIETGLVSGREVDSLCRHLRVPRCPRIP
jgi:hypothetical protein